MTIAEADRFYEQDERKYELAKNQEFLIWLQNIMSNGYQSLVELEDLQDMIDFIALWFEMKYPERELRFYEGCKSLDFDDIQPLSKVMDIRQLMYRLPHEILCLMQGKYRSLATGVRKIYDNNGDVIAYKTIILMRLSRKDEQDDSYDMEKKRNLCIYADSATGQVEMSDEIKDIAGDKEVTLAELLAILRQNYGEVFDLTPLERCLYNQVCDIELREKTLQLVALRLLYSRMTIPERGYERAKRFINEFNKKLGFELSSDEIDELIGKSDEAKKAIPEVNAGNRVRERKPKKDRKLVIL